MSMGQAVFPYSPDFSTAKRIGNIEGNSIFYFEDKGYHYYGLQVGGDIASWLKTKPINDKMEEINNAQTYDEYKSKGFMKKLLFFVKGAMQKSLIMGNVQSRETQFLIKSIAKTKMFNMFWLNMDTGEKHPYEMEKDNPDLEPYRSWLSPTAWQVMIEGHENDRFYKAMKEYDEEGAYFTLVWKDYDKY